MSYDTYTSPLASRNASEAMLRLWSPRHKFNTWRRIWLAVAEAQHELTKDAASPLVTKEQLEELRAVVYRPGGITDAEMKAAEKYERELRHDVMAHVHALGDSCPKAKGIIHLGMTSQDVVCNADLGSLWSAMHLIHRKVLRVAASLEQPMKQWKHLATLGFTHYQPAQPVTVGRRCANWASDLLITGAGVQGRLHYLNFVRRGLRGATGTQASYLALLGDDSSAVDFLEADFLYELDEKDWDTKSWRLPRDVLMAQRDRIAKQHATYPSEIPTGGSAFGTTILRRLPNLSSMSESEYRHHLAIQAIESRTFGVLGQTYPRVIDTFILADLASVASVLHKIATDIRLLSNRKELDEPFESKQIGSSAMPYKRNPMRCERICGLTRFVMNLVGNAYDTAATQWLERTLDDSSNRRLSLPEAFLALDGALDLMHNVASGLIVHEAMVRKNLMAELPFMATENILMACVKLGGDRQEYHEIIRQHAQAAGMRVKQEGLDNDLLDRLKNDKHFWSVKRGGPLREELDWEGVMDPMRYVGRSVEQTERFIKEVVEPLREQYKDELAKLEESAPKV